MFCNKSSYFEILAFSKIDREPCYMDKCMNEGRAKAFAKTLKDRYLRVEVNEVFFNADCPDDLLGDRLVAAYENGEQTA